MIKKIEAMRTETRGNMRGGNGDISLVHMFEQDELLGKARLAARVTVPVGASVGKHVHDPDAEMLIILSGSARVDDNGEIYTLKAGDVMLTGGGQFHEYSNDGDVPLEMIALVLL